MDKKTIQREAAKLRREVLKYVKSRATPVPKTRIHYLHPRYAFEMLGVTYEECPDLDLELRVVGEQMRFGRSSVIVGCLDRPNKTVATSERSPPAERRFTAAHELAHWVLHKGMIEHRDRPIVRVGPRPKREREADEFAAAYLMPRKWVTEDLRARFGTLPVDVDEDLAWWLDRTDPERLLDRSYRDGSVAIALNTSTPNAEADYERARAMAIAVCTSVGAGHFCSLADEYGVSATAMALRLLELDLIKRN